uniref:Sodium channel protein n=1 Tax=Phallusia mammillata TaxID=59560 RepID=A0A6F9DSE7_9ASCI|nr:sodium channel protein 1 brain-like [Phallusia mammillata]
MLTILVNCVFLGLDEEIPNAEYFFTAFYSMELVIKVGARGFVLERFTYLRDPWNWLDLIVLIVAYTSLAGTPSVSSLRSFRVLRALKSVSIVPGLKTIVNALFHSMKPLAEVLLIMGFLLIVVSLIALQAYQGVLRRRCVRFPTPVGNQSVYDLLHDRNYTTNQSNWNPVEGEEVVCGNGTGSGFCPQGYVCLPDVADNPNFGNTNFDNMPYALLTSLQLLTLDFWENVYNMIIRAEGPWNVLFFLMSVFLGPFYLLNLLLAVVTLAYHKEHEKQEDLEQERTLAKERAKRKQLRRKKLLEQKTAKRSNAVAPTEQAPSTAQSITDIVACVRATAQANALDHSSDLRNNDISGTKHLAVGKNGAPKNKLQSFSNSRKDVSVDSSDSTNQSTGKWESRVKSLKTWWTDSFCSWQCHPTFLWFQRGLKIIVKSKIFEFFIILCIVINTVFLAIDHHGIPTELENALSVGNKVFTFVFLAEAVLKILALNPIGYLKNPWNLFDFLIVVISIVEFLLVAVLAGNGFTVLRTLRLLRVFRLARMWETMNKLVSIIWKSISDVSYLTVVLFLVLYIFAVIGKQWYSNAYMMSASRFEDNQIPRWHFGDFYHSFLMVWRVMCGEWIEPLYDCLHINNGDGRCIVLFLSITFFANFMILNLFTAILLEAFEVDELKAKKKKDKNSVVPNAEDGTNNKPKLDDKRQDKTDGNIGGYDRRESSASQIFELNHCNAKKQSHAKRDLNGTSLHTLNESPEENVQNKVKPNRQPLQRQQSMDKSSENLPARNIFLTAETISELDEENETSFARQNLRSSTNISRENSETFPKIEENVSKNKTSSGICCISLDLCACSNAREEEGSQNDFISENNEENHDEPPPCLPNAFLQRYPQLKEEASGKTSRYWHAIRKSCFMLVEHPFFEWFILFLILASTVCLTLEDIHLENDPVKKDILEKLEYVFTALFTLEMLLKWIGIGFTKYFTQVWCILDSAIVAASWAGILLQSQASQFRVLRALRAFRPLRAVSRWQGMKVVVDALIYCIPSIGNVLCVCLLIWFVFGIIGVQYFKGQFYRCVDASDNMVNDSAVVNKTTCLDSPNDYRWVNRNINFDNVGIAMVALFQVATFEGWIELMADSTDVTGEDQQPIRNFSQYNTIFYVVFVLVGSFFILNLIVGVIIESFQKLRKQTDSSSAVETLLTDSQKQFYKTMRTMLNRKPKKTIPPPTNRVQLQVFHLVTNSRFELGVFVLIVLNMITLSMEHYQMNDIWRDSLRICDITFTSLFALEATLKLIGMRYYYFRDVFNVFDFLVVVVSITGFILENLIAFIVSPTLLRVVRVFRVFRVLRVVRAARGIRRLILTLMISIPALFNIAVLLSVFMVIFAILGMTMFMHVKLSGALNDQVNFQTFGNALLVLFRLVTSAGWNDVLEPLMNTRNCNPDLKPVSDCGDPVGAIIYFVVFIFVVFLVIVNMYIAIILENFDEIFKQDESGVSQGDFETFYMVWGRYDPKATQFVTLTELSNLLHDLHPPFQLPKPNLVKIGALDLPVLYGDKVHCLDVLFALVKRILGEVEISEEMRLEAEERLLRSFPNRKTLKAETTTLVLRQQIRAAKVIQDAWKTFSTKKRKEVLGVDNNKNVTVTNPVPSSAHVTTTNEFTNSSTSMISEAVTKIGKISNAQSRNVDSSKNISTLIQVDAKLPVDEDIYAERLHDQAFPDTSSQTPVPTPANGGIDESQGIGNKLQTYTHIQSSATDIKSTAMESKLDATNVAKSHPQSVNKNNSSILPLTNVEDTFNDYKENSLIFHNVRGYMNEADTPTDIIRPKTAMELGRSTNKKLGGRPNSSTNNNVKSNGNKSRQEPNDITVGQTKNKLFY